MTRDEAIELRVTRYSGSQEWKRKCAAEDVDNYVALGMLKLDEPKLVERVYVVAADALEDRGVRCNSLALEAILSGANLKIVEK